MRSEKEIKEYLGIEDDFDYIPEMIKSAKKIEEKFADEIKNGSVGYAMIGDFPTRVEDGAVWLNTVYENGIETLDVYAIPL